MLFQYYSVLQSTTPVLLCTTKYYSVPQSTTPVLLCTTKYYSSTTLYYKVLLQYYSVLQSTTPVLRGNRPKTIEQGRPRCLCKHVTEMILNVGQCSTLIDPVLPTVLGIFAKRAHRGNRRPSEVRTGVMRKMPANNNCERRPRSCGCKEGGGRLNSQSLTASSSSKPFLSHWTQAHPN